MSLSDCPTSNAAASALSWPFVDEKLVGSSACSSVASPLLLLLLGQSPGLAWSSSEPTKWEIRATEEQQKILGVYPALPAITYTQSHSAAQHSGLALAQVPARVSLSTRSNSEPSFRCFCCSVALRAQQGRANGRTDVGQMTRTVWLLLLLLRLLCLPTLHGLSSDGEGGENVCEAAHHITLNEEKR